jgi:hypothetical protein
VVLWREPRQWVSQSWPNTMSLELLQSSIGYKHTCPIPQLYLRNVHCKCTQITIRYWRTSPKLIQEALFFLQAGHWK